ncbi:MAG: transposase [Oscillospiraceae bacterium]|nr:transposase [Oscillospiraceae bacterium]
METRKNNRLSEYDYGSIGAYFITVCVKDKQKILSHIVGDGALDVPKVELTHIGKIVNKYIRSTNNIENVTVDKYVIMPNHIHILVSITADTRDVEAPSPTNKLIPRVVSALKRLSNREIGYNIFQRSYYDHIIRNDADYIEKWNYIDNNPIKWEMNKNDQG